MSKSIRRLAVIPARGNSKRIKNKNLKKFVDKPIINFTIENAKKSNLFSTIHISTESEKITKHISKLGFKPDFKRPKYLSKDNASIFSVVYYVYNQYFEKNILFDEIWLLTATSPLISYNDLKNASIFFREKKNLNPLISVSKFKAPIEWSFTMNKFNILKPINKKNLFKRSQNFSDKYFDTGSFAIFNPSNLRNSDGKFFKGKFCGYEIDQFKAADIDNYQDWKYAEKIYKSINYFKQTAK